MKKFIKLLPQNELKLREVIFNIQDPANVQFQVSGSDPKGDNVEFGLLPLAIPNNVQWNSTGSFDLTIDQSHINETLWIYIAIKSPRDFHPKREVGLGEADDIVKFGFEVLPPRS